MRQQQSFSAAWAESKSSRGGEGEGGSQSKWLCCLSNQQDPAQKPILQVIDQTVYVPGEAP